MSINKSYCQIGISLLCILSVTVAINAQNINLNSTPPYNFYKLQTETRDLNGELLGAILHKDIGQIKQLIKEGADPNAVYKNDSLLSLTVINTLDIETIETLISLGANPNIRDASQTTPLMIASFNKDYQGDRYPDVMKALVAGGADINLRDSDGKTALILAITSSSESEARIVTRIKYLISLDAQINIQDNNSYSALMYAVKYHRNKIAKILISAGADINAKDSFGQTVLTLARQEKLTDIIKLLESMHAEE